MSQRPIVTDSTGHRSADESMSPKDCEALLRRACFGHVAFGRDGRVDVLPIQYAFLEGWVYFRADLGLREAIAHNPWLVLSVTEFQDTNWVSSVIVRGGCYQTEETGTAIGDAAARRGIMKLRDGATGGPERQPRIRRSSTVFRIHVDEMRGITAFVPRRARAPRTPVEAAGADTLRSTIGQTLAETPLDEAILRRDVWSYVGTEQHAGTSAGHVIMVLVKLIEKAAIIPLVDRQALTRRVILWGVEAYFGHLSGDVVGRNGMALSDSPAETQTA